MKTSSRRRVLISSVAMLLVAMLALGTATFAWFTNNKSVTADGMQVKAAAAKGLQITGDNGNAWGPTYTFKTSAILQPVSAPYTTSNAYSKFTKAYYPSDVKVTGAWSADKNANFSGWKDDAGFPVASTTAGQDAYGKNSYFIAYEVGVRSTGDPITDVKMKVSYEGDKAEEYIRVAVLEQAGTGTAITSDTIKTVIGSEDSANAISAVTPAVTAQKLEAGGTEITVADVTTAPKYYTVLVWFEGQDTQCVDENQGVTGNVEINFYYA